MKVAVYVRVSTDEQTCENQKRELLAVAKQREWEVVEFFEDHGISGAKGRDKRPALDNLLKRAVRVQVHPSSGVREIKKGEFDIVMAWSVDRLGRSLSDLVTMLNDMQAAGVGLYLHQQALDTTTPSGRAMFQMVGVFAEFERSMIQERVKAGLERAKAAGKKLGARPRLNSEQRADIKFRLSMGESPTALAEEYGVTRQTIYRIRDEPEEE